MAAQAQRLINRRRQGDLGEASAIEWLTRRGANVLTPLGHSPDFDLVAEIEGHLLRVQVKTTTQISRTPDGHLRFPVLLATNGGNQSWTGVCKRFDPSRADHVYVHTGEGRRWFLPANAIKAGHSIHLGSPKYAEFEIDSGTRITPLVYGKDSGFLESEDTQGEYPRGQRTAAVNRQALPSQVRLLPPPLAASTSTPRARFRPSRYERKAGKNGRAVINQKRRVTLPQQALLDAGLKDGDWVQASADGPGRLLLEKAGLPIWAEGNE